MDLQFQVQEPQLYSKGELLYAEYTHSHAIMNEDGVETGEGGFIETSELGWVLIRIPTVTGDGGGRCSRVTFEVLDPTQITGLNQVDYLPGNPPPNGTTTDPQGRFWLLKQGTFPSGVDYAGGQVKLTAETHHLRQDL